MRIRARVLLSLLFLLTAARVGLAKCDPSVEPDRSDVANARAAVAAACDCAGAASHGAYVSCAVQQANAALVNKSCAGAVKRCAAKSTCGRPGFVTCCRTMASGKTSCATKRSAASCVAPHGGSACVGSVPSCCDACGAGGCAATTTTTTTSSTSTSTTIFPPPCGLDGNGACSGLCPSLSDVCVQDAVTGACVCVLGPCRAFGGIGSCGGTCPSPAVCTLVPGACQCVVFCAGSAAPACGGVCVPPQVCGFNPTTSACECGP